MKPPAKYWCILKKKDQISFFHVFVQRKKLIKRSLIFTAFYFSHSTV